MKKIAITGTKGKTTAVYLAADILERLRHNILKVDTTGHFINGARRSTAQESLKLWGLVPSVAPGRFLYEFKVDPVLSQDEDALAILECSLGSSTLSGMGYALHNVGVFLNVYEDHLGSTERLKTKEDILTAKSFIFRRIAHDGWAVPNADDALVMSGLPLISEQHNIRVLPFGIDFTHFDLSRHLEKGGGAVTIENGHVIYKRAEKVEPIVSLAALPWTFNGTFMPSVYNLMAAIAAIIAHYDGELPKDFTKTVAATRLDPEQGRLTLLETEQGVRILADYAHEKISLTEVAGLAHSLTTGEGKVIGVVRLAYDRTDELIKDTGSHIADKFDQFVVYDKIDGYWRQPKDKLYNKKFRKQVTGHVSQVFTDAISAKNPQCERIIREDQAAKRAAEIAKPGDVIVYIVNDDVSRSLGFIKEYFKAELV